MDIVHNFESHTVCIFRQAFLTDFSCKINFKFNFHESVDFQKNAINIIFTKMQKMFHELVQEISFVKFLKSATSRHCSNDTKEADNLDCCGLLNLGVFIFNTAIYGKIVRCSFKSFEQYTIVGSEGV